MLDQGRSAASLIQLAGAEPFGVGGRRSCYVHPTDPSKCVKIARTDERATIRAKKTLLPSHWRRKYDNNADELKQLTDLFSRIGPTASEHLPRCYGMQDTDLGPGLVMDLVRDDDGKISRSLRELLSGEYPPETFDQAFDDLGRFLIRHVVLTRSILDHNLAAQERADGSWRLVMIDGYGDRAWLPVARWSRSIGRSKIRRRLDEAAERFQTFWKSGGVTKQLIDASSWGQGFLNHRG